MPVRDVRVWAVQLICEDKSVLCKVFDDYEQMLLFVKLLRNKGRHPEIWQL